jgi:hypothetical protein
MRLASGRGNKGWYSVSIVYINVGLVQSWYNTELDDMPIAENFDGAEFPF